MALKRKLFLTISLFALTFAILIVGVWALKTGDFKVGGNISFFTTGINATISKGVLANGTVTDSTNKMKEVVLNTSKTTAEIEEEFLSWQNLDLSFNNSGDDVTISFSITNNNTNIEHYISVEVAVYNGAMDNAFANINTSSAILSPNGGSQNFVITFSVIDKKANASLSGFEIILKLNHLLPSNPTDDYSYLTFSYSDEASSASLMSTRAATLPLTASVTGFDKSVTSVEIPTLIKNNSKVYQVTSIGNNAFGSCTGITSVSIPGGVTSIGANAFTGCTSLSSITFPGSVTSIGDDAFYECTGLSSIIIPNSVTSIGHGAFTGCESLANMNYLGTLKDWVGITFADEYSNPTWYTKDLVIQGHSITSISGADLDGATSIGAYAFTECRSLSSVTIPRSVISIGSLAFNACLSLANMNYLGTLKDWVGITFGNEGSNPTCYTKDLVIQGHSVTSISGADLDGATSIGAYAFTYCTSLSSVTIPSSVISIGESAFSWCYDLTSVTIPKSVTSIGSSAFGSSVSALNVDSINYLGTIKDWLNISFGGNITGQNMVSFNPVTVEPNPYVLMIQGLPITSITAEDLAGVTSISDCAFAGCSTLSSVNIPSGVTGIGANAFDNCESLSSVTIPSGVVSIGEGAFYNCESLSSVTIPSSVTSIGRSAFGGCENLNTIKIDSESIWSGYTPLLNTSQGCLLANATTVYVKTEIVNSNSFYSLFAASFSNVETITSGEYSGYTKHYKS